MRTQRRRFVTIAAVVLGLAVTTVVLAFYVVRVVEGVRRAAEDSRRVEQRFVEQWLAEQKKGLASGERSDVHFYSTSNTDVLIRRFAGMPEIKKLTFQSTDLTDEGVKVVAGLPNLRELTLYGGMPRVGNAGLATLCQNQTLETLRLINVNVTDNGLAVLGSFPRLKNLTIYREAFRDRLLTDTAVRDLRNLNKLDRLNVGGGWMSTTAVAQLRTSLPDCEVVEKLDDDEW